MSKSFGAPRAIRRIAARRVFHSANGKPVVLTIGVPRPVPGSDWGCAVQITGLNSIWQRPKYVFGIDGLQALHLAMKCAGAVLESTKMRLEFLGQTDDLGLPTFLPELPKRERARLAAIVEREATKYWRGLERARSHFWSESIGVTSRMRTPLRHSSTDVVGRDVQIGDWVRVVSVPDSIARMPRASKRAFSRAVGKTFQIEAFDESGCAELNLTGKVGLDTIWIEPFCVRRVRRPGEHSLRFRRIPEIRRKLERPRWSFRYVAKYRKTDDPAKLIKRMQRFETNHAWYVLERRREIHGTFYAPDRRASSKRQLQELRKRLTTSDLFASLHLARVRLEQAK